MTLFEPSKATSEPDASRPGRLSPSKEQKLRKLRDQSAPARAMSAIKAASLAIAEGRHEFDSNLCGFVLSTMNYAGQRPVQDHHVALLVDSMNRGQWTPGSQLAFGRLHGVLYLVNGQHRLHAVRESGRSQVFQVLIVDVATEQELAELYYRFDVMQRGRSIAEVLNATGIAERYGIGRSILKAGYEAVGLIGNDFGRCNYQIDPIKTRSVDWRLEAASKWWPHLKKYEAMIDGAAGELKSRLRNAGMVAVGLVTIFHQSNKAADFWGGIAENDGLRKNDPRHTLIQTLMTRSLREGGDRTRSGVPATAWNAFYRGVNISFIRFSPTTSLRILGTPYHVGKKAD